MTPPTGPVLLDLPMDVLTAQVDASAVRIPSNVIVESAGGPFDCRRRRSARRCFEARSARS